MLDAGDIAPADRLFFYKAGFGAGSPAGFTNYFRYTLLERSDTISIDAMSSASRAIGPRKRRCWPPGRTRITSTARCWGFPDKRRSCRAEAERLGKDIGWGQAGPFLLTRVLAEFGLTSSVFAPVVFYPIHYSEGYKPFMPEYKGEVNAPSKASLAIHLWHSLVRYTNFDKTLLPDEDSFFGQAVLRHATAAYFKRRDRSEYLAHVTACRDMGLPG